MIGDDDTSHFEDVEKDNSPEGAFEVPKAYAGNHLPFIGFTYNKEYQYVLLFILSELFYSQLYVHLR